MSSVKIFLSVLVLALALAPAGCKKSDSPTPSNNNNNNNNNNNTTTNPYYFRFLLNGVTDTINADGANSYSQNANYIFSEISPVVGKLYPYISLAFSIPNWYDTVTESNVLGLAGRKVYFTDTFMKPEIEYQETSATNTWYSGVFSDTSYYVKIASVTFLDTANYQGYGVRRYIVNGTCRAEMSQIAGTNPVPLTGSFNLIVTRVVRWP